MHPAAVYLEGCRVVMLLLVEERGALQDVPAEMINIFLTKAKCKMGRRYVRPVPVLAEPEVVRNIGQLL